MEFSQQYALTEFVPLRTPSRSNHFTVLVKARLDSKQVLLQQSRIDRGRNGGRDMEVWMEILASDSRAQQESHLLHVRGELTQPLPQSVTPKVVPGSFASTHLPLRPIHVVDFCERGSLRDCLDRGDFLSQTEGGRSDWTARLTVLKDVATALHYIQCNMHGQEHGAVSSNAVFLDKEGRAFLSWHRSGVSRHEFASGSCQDWRWFAPPTLLQLKRKLDQKSATPSQALELEPDDMYSFGVLAWEIATEELPFENLPSLHSLGQDQNSAEARFLRKASQPLRKIIQECLHPDREKRPSWCTIMSQMEALSPEAFETVADDANDAGEDEQPAKELPNKVSPAPSAPSGALNEDKSKVVEIMESVLSSTFYRKELPAHLDSITSAAGRKLFREMILARTSECFFSLCTSFNTQSDPAFCGVSSLSMVLNALEIDPRRQWRGVWRWYSEEQLDCCASVDEMRLKGITFNQFGCLARCHAKVVAKRADRHTLEEFRRDIQAISSSEGSHMVMSFSRAALGQTGSGHFSPIGGYHAGEDKALVLDCARFKYPPFYATVEELWASLLPKDPETGECRGYFLISATAKQKLDIQRRKLQAITGMSGTGLSSTVSSASSSSVSISLQTESSDGSAFVPSLVPDAPPEDPLAVEGDRTECDCNCTNPNKPLPCGAE